MSEKITGTQSIDRALDLLTRIVTARGPVTLTELVADTGLAKGTTSRILSALERAHMIARSPIGGFEPGTLLNNFAVNGGAYNALVEAVTPAMEELARTTHETVNLGVASPSGLNSIAQVDGSYILGMRSWVGEYVPLHCTASGKVLLAYGAGEAALNLVALETFWCSDVGQKIRAQDGQVRRELPFTARMDVAELRGGNFFALALEVGHVCQASLPHLVGNAFRQPPASIRDDQLDA